MSLSVFYFISYPSCCCSSSLMFLFPGHVVCQDFTLTWLYVSYLLFNSFFNLSIFWCNFNCNLSQLFMHSVSRVSFIFLNN